MLGHVSCKWSCYTMCNVGYKTDVTSNTIMLRVAASKPLGSDVRSLPVTG